MRLSENAPSPHRGVRRPVELAELGRSMGASKAPESGLQIGVECRVARWLDDDYFGVAAVVEVCADGGDRGYLVSPLSGGLIGAFPLKGRGGRACAELVLPPGVYRYKVVVDSRGTEERECQVEPPAPLVHVPAPYYVGAFGGEVEVRAYSVEPPQICGGGRCAEGEELLAVGRHKLYRAVVEGPPYEVRCCGTEIRVDSVRPFRRPRWAPLVMYEVLPDRVRRRFGCRDLRWDHCGGDLRDLADMLDYIAQLADALYIHPIYRAISYHRYDVLDHKSVDELLGGLQAYEELKRRASERGVGVVLDVVLHHVGLKSAMFRERRDLFIIRDEKAAEWALEIASIFPRPEWRRFFRGDPPYETFMAVWAMPRINYEKAEALAYAESVLSFWSDKAEGFRFDVAHGIPPEVWRKLLERYAETHYLLAEHTGDPSAFLGAHHGFTAYELYGAILDFLAFEKIDAGEFAARVKRYIGRLAPGQLRYMYTFIENHDTDRFCSRADKRRTLMAYALIYSMPGIPGLYAGGESCAEGLAADHTNRRPLDDLKPDPEMLAALRTLYRIRRRYPEIAEGPIREIRGEGGRLVLKNASIVLYLERDENFVEIKTPDGYYSF
ncbi:alpha-amylase family glycosyl hydrolase [Thermoproteus uzoniensis]|nr:alpha-amylase family glycosyl hydrolase [Thermoproteus uzoniensis]